MDSCGDTPKGWVAPFGHPRIKACSRLPVAFRSVPRPSSPPGAKASTECPSLARITNRHAQEPSTPGITPAPKPRTCQPRPRTHYTIASERRCRLRRTDLSDRPGRLQPARPETHQNLIHLDKDRPAHRRPVLPQEAARRRPDPDRARHASHVPPCLLCDAGQRGRGQTRPLPGGGDRTRTDDPLLAKQVLSQLSYTPEPVRDMWWAREDLNLRPHAYQACALTN